MPYNTPLSRQPKQQPKQQPEQQHGQQADTPGNAPLSPDQLRRSKRAQRRDLSAKQQHKHARLLCQNLIKQKNYRNSQNIACYLTNDSEIDPHQLIEHAWFCGKKVFLPILSPLKHALYFAPYQVGSKLQLNRYGIPEPVCHPAQWKTAQQLDLLLLPLVAFDIKGNRIGMGGGFYDRTLAYLQHRQYWRKPVLIGLAHELQKVEQLNVQRWDIPLDYIASEKKIYSV